jgi:hypothetical protein
MQHARLNIEASQPIGNHILNSDKNGIGREALSWSRDSKRKEGNPTVFTTEELRIINPVLDDEPCFFLIWSTTKASIPWDKRLSTKR